MQAVAERPRDTGRCGNISDVMRMAPRLLKEHGLDFPGLSGRPLGRPTIDRARRRHE